MKKLVVFGFDGTLADTAPGEDSKLEKLNKAFV